MTVGCPSFVFNEGFRDLISDMFVSQRWGLSSDRIGLASAHPIAYHLQCLIVVWNDF